MLYREIMTADCENHTAHTHKPLVDIIKVLDVEADITYSNRPATGLKHVCDYILMR